MPDHDMVLEGILAIARRETLVLAAALQVFDREAAFVAAGRLRWSLANAQQFAAYGSAGCARLNPRLVAVVRAAERWLPTDSQAALSTTRLRHLLAQTREPLFRLRPINASNTLLVELDLDDLPLVQLALRGATVADVCARRARLDALDAAAATIIACHFQTATLRTSGFEQAWVEGCDFSRADLERTRWSGATVSRCSFRGACLVDARLDGSTFNDCDFGDADLQSHAFTAATGIAGARFIRCDLREANWQGRSLHGASFIDCKLCGVRGAVDVAEALIERPDLSKDGDGSKIGTQSEIVARWSTPIPLAIHTWS